MSGALKTGPRDIVIGARQFVGEGFFIIAFIVWIAAPFAYLVGQGWLGRALLWPSLSADAILLGRVTNAAPRVQPAPFAEDPGEEQGNGMLRTEKAADEKPGGSRSPSE
jgi:hypothetical protein